MNVAIIDDDPCAARVTKITVEDAGHNPWLFEGDSSTIVSTAEVIMNHSDAAVCDHRLRPLGFADFDGAELVAYLIGRKFPAVLISQFVNQDNDVSIRHWRATLPSVVCRDDLEAETLENAIQICKREISGLLTSERRSHRTLLRIVEIRDEDNQQVVDAIVPSWAVNSAVRFPLNIVPLALRSGVASGAHLIAYVNLGARNSQELYFDRFETPPTPNESLFDHP